MIKADIGAYFNQMFSIRKMSNKGGRARLITKEHRLYNVLPPRDC